MSEIENRLVKKAIVDRQPTVGTYPDVSKPTDYGTGSFDGAASHTFACYAAEEDRKRVQQTPASWSWAWLLLLAIPFFFK